MAEEEAKRQRERERVMGYRLAPLNKRERCVACVRALSLAGGLMHGRHARLSSRARCLLQRACANPDMPTRLP